MATPRQKNQPYVTSILKENLIHFAGNSTLEINPGEAELILIGEYVSDGEVVEMMRDPVSPDVTLAIGDTPVSDDFRIAEIDSYRGSYLALTFTGKMSDGTRRVLYDGTVRSDSTGSGNVKAFVKMVSDEEILYDSYFTGVNESPLSAFRNASNLSTVPISSLFPQALAKRIGGIPIYSGTIFRGNAAYKRKPQTGVSAKFSAFSYGQFKDLLEGVENTKTHTVTRLNAARFNQGPIKVRFFSGSDAIDPSLTTSINISPTAIVETPYFDVEPPSGSFDTLIVTL
jgi:hypothetical protein